MKEATKGELRRLKVGKGIGERSQGKKAALGFLTSNLATQDCVGRLFSSLDQQEYC